jgi:hypothetical protein
MKPVEYVARELEQLCQYYYSVERYLVGLKRLTILARPMLDADKPVYITFTTVKYMQMPTYWQESPFKLATSSECRAFLERRGIEVGSSLPSLFYAQLAKSYVYVVCWNVETSETMPPP